MFKYAACSAALQLLYRHLHSHKSRPTQLLLQLLAVGGFAFNYESHLNLCCDGVLIYTHFRMAGLGWMVKQAIPR